MIRECRAGNKPWDHWVYPQNKTKISYCLGFCGFGLDFAYLFLLCLFVWPISQGLILGLCFGRAQGVNRWYWGSNLSQLDVRQTPYVLYYLSSPKLISKPGKPCTLSHHRELMWFFPAFIWKKISKWPSQWPLILLPLSEFKNGLRWIIMAVPGLWDFSLLPRRFDRLFPLVYPQDAFTVYSCHWLLTIFLEHQMDCLIFLPVSFV